MNNEFGGAWTEIKLKLINDYLNFFPIALKKLGFNLHYIDLFSGTGHCQIKRNGEVVEIDGSAKIALESQIPFDSYHFIEKDHNKFLSLESFTSKYPKRNIHCYNDDANTKIVEICNNLNPVKDRAVAFIDPFAMSFDWKSLELISKTKVVDIWYLFPFMALFRQACIDKSNIDEGKRNAINKILGTTEWENDIYKPSMQTDMFDSNKEERINVENLKDYIEKRFRNVFPFVNKPVVLKTNNSPLFLLFFAISNDSPKAIGLAKKVSDDIIKRLLS